MIVDGRLFWSQDEVSNLVQVQFDDYQVWAYKERQNLLYDMLHSAALSEPNKVGLVFEGNSYTYKELEDKVFNMVNSLKNDYHVNVGDIVAILMENRPELVISLFAVTYIGAIACILNARLNPNEILSVLRDCSAKILISDSAWIEKIQPLLGNTSVELLMNVDHLSLDSLFEKIGDKSFLFNDLKEKISPNEPAIILYTSGTTKKPKGVIITHFNIFNSVISYYRILKISKYDSTVIAVPLSYVTGLIAQLLLFIYCKGTVYLMKEFHGEKLLRLFHEKQITFFHSTAAIYNIMLNVKNRADYDVSSMKMALCGGGPAPKRMISSIKKWMPWLDFRTVYGLTETSSPASILPKYPIEENYYTCGKPIPVIELKIINESNKDLDFNEIGEILLKGGVIVPGYWNNIEETNKTFYQGWLSTGDIGKVDESGFLYILDRKKDVIIRGGENIYSFEIENLLLENPKISDVAVIGVEDPIMGEEVKVCIVLKEGASMTADEVRQWVVGSLARFKVPKYVEFVEFIPKNANGKPIKWLLK